MNEIRNLCKAEGITSVKEFRTFFEYWIIGNGEMDDDFNSATKRIKRMLTVSQWKKLYKPLTDDAISECLATTEEKKESDENWRAEQDTREIAEIGKSDEEKALEQEARTQMQDADCEYDASLTWEQNVEKYANNPSAKKEEIRQAVERM